MLRLLLLRITIVVTELATENDGEESTVLRTTVLKVKKADAFFNCWLLHGVKGGRAWLKDGW